MKHEFLNKLLAYFEQKTNATSLETDLLNGLKEELDYFPVAYVSREDLEWRGFDTSNVTDDDMVTLAEDLGDDYCEQLFWSSMEIIAHETLEIPKYIYPKCGKSISGQDSYYDDFECLSCKNKWEKERPTGAYVLVEYPEDTSFYDDNDVGYPCFNSSYIGAVYVPEHFYKQRTGKQPEPDRLFRPVEWPDSEKYMQIPPDSATATCEPIEKDEKAIEDFGSRSVWVPLCLIG